MTKHIFTLDEAALAYANVAERIWAKDTAFLDKNPALVPIFVSNLFQSLEISIKHIGISAKLFTEKEARNSPTKAGKKGNGHDVEDLARLAILAVQNRSQDSFLAALTCASNNPYRRAAITEMIFGERFKKTRECYTSRHLGYGEIVDGDFSIDTNIEDWIAAVRGVAENSHLAIRILRPWRTGY